MRINKIYKKSFFDPWRKILLGYEQQKNFLKGRFKDIEVVKGLYNV